MNTSQIIPQNESEVDLDTIITTGELSRRPTRLPEFAVENRALVELARAMAASPDDILTKLAETALALCHAHSAGLSLLEPDGKRFRWPTIVGKWANQMGGGTPRNDGPCGAVLDRDAAQLMARPERHFKYLASVTPLIEEVLLIPFHVEDKAVGTVWVVSHDESRRFDAEDLRVMTNLGTFAAAAYQVSGQNADLTQRLAQLRQANVEVRDSRRAALNVMEDMRHEAAERKLAEESLRQSEDRFRMVADNISQLAWTCDQLGNVIWYNRRWLEYTGLSFDEMEGWNWSKVQHPDHLDRVVARVKRSAESGEPWEDTFPLRGSDGSYRWFLSRALPIRDPAGDIVCWFGTNTDITEQREAEEALKHADRRKNEFLAMLAHELRNPLAPIRNAAQLLRLARNNGEAVKSASLMMERQIEHIVRLVDDLLDVSRVSRGKIELRQERIELASSINHAVEAARPLYESTDHELTIMLPREPIYLNADPIRLTQIIGNLLNNAYKFTNLGGRVWLTVEAENGQAAIRVRDDGIGIAADQLPRVFDMFTQLDASLERSVGGLGIGLTLVKSLVEMHGGTAEVHSAGLGQGSEFTVRLPVLGREGIPQPLAPKPTISPPAPATGRRILVVDDNQDSAISLAMLLKLAGNETRTAHDGLEALEAAAAFRPEVALLDIGLPKLNGYEVARKIRQQPWGKDMTLVAVSGWGQDEDRQKSKDAGFNAHLVKPVDYAALSALLAEE